MTSSFFTSRNVVNTLMVLLFGFLFCLVTSFTKEARHPRPFSGSFDLTLTVIDPTLPLVRITGSGPGTATHMGQSWYESQSVIDYSVVPLELRGDVVFTAANGDELHTSFTGSPILNSDGSETIIRQFTVTGGTGRFEDATGSFTGTTITSGPVTPGNLPLSGPITLKGMISY